MGLIEEIRSENFQWWNLKDCDTLGERFDDIEIMDWTICFNDRQYDYFRKRYKNDEKMTTLTRGILYQVLEKGVKKGDKVVKIKNDKGKLIWILTDRFAFNPELAQNNVRTENLKRILDDEDIQLE